MEHCNYFKALRFIGIHPDQVPNKYVITIFFSTICYLFVTLALQIYLKGHVEALLSLITICYLFQKFLSLVFKRNPIINVLRAMKFFWNADIVDENISFYKRYIMTLEKFCLVYFLIGFPVFVLKPFFTPIRSMFDSYIPEKIPFPCIYAGELSVMIILAISYFGFNFLTCKTIIFGAMQFRLLNLKVKTIDFTAATENALNLDKCMKELNHWIKYHIFLIRYIEQLNVILSTPLALMMINSISMMCVNTYTMSISGVPRIEYYRAIVISLAVITEFSVMFGMPAQLLMDEAAETANVIYYECSWYLRNLVPLRKHLVMIIQRSHRGIFIRAGDYHIINNETILLLIKTAYSFYTFLQTVT